MLCVTCKGNIFRPSFDMPSFDMLCKRLKDRLTVKQAIFRLLAAPELSEEIIEMILV